MATEWMFYSSLILLFYTFLGYPLLLFVLSLFIKRDVLWADIQPEVTIVIPVHNEEKQIAEKLQNCLNFDYPWEKLTILVASDGSTDNTENIVKGFASEQIRFLPLPSRGGKVVAQNYAVQFCESELIIFTDVAILTHPDCIKLIVQNFFDNKIGAVSCRDVIVGEKKGGEGSYIEYDMFVRKYTSQIGSLIGVTGGFYAVRAEIAKGGWNPAYPPDFYVALRTIKHGLRVIEDIRVHAHYKVAAKAWDELPRKVRTINRGMHAFFSPSGRILLNPFKYGFISLELLSQKLFRWLMPFFSLTLFFSNFLLLDTSVMMFFFFVLQVLGYCMALTGFLLEKKIDINLFKFVFYFVMANIALLTAWYEFIIGKQHVVWQPTKR